MIMIRLYYITYSEYPNWREEEKVETSLAYIFSFFFFFRKVFLIDLTEKKKGEKKIVRKKYYHDRIENKIDNFLEWMTIKVRIIFSLACYRVQYTILFYSGEGGGAQSDYL